MKNLVWYEKLLPSDRIKFDCNFNTHKPGKLFYYLFSHEEYEETFFNFISGGFIWGRTPEGHEYWVTIAESGGNKVAPIFDNSEVKSITLINNINYEGRHILV